MESSGQATRQDYLSEIENESTTKDFSVYQITDVWKGFRLNIEQTLWCTIMVRFNPHEFELAYYVTGMDSVTQVLSGRYDIILLPEQIDRYATVILDGIYKALERLTEERTGELKTEKEKEKEAP